MGNVVIHAEGISKRYRIGARKQRYRTLRETLSEGAMAPFRRMQSVARGQSATASQEILWALRDVSFEVGHGEVLGIVGRNGSGKSTLLKILSRITEPTEGYIDVQGRVGSLLEVGTGFHPELTGRENTFLNGAILGMKRSEIESKFDEIVAFAEIDKFIDTPVKRYSSGMYTRLAFAVAAHLEPEILIVDEVLAVGDAAFQKKCLGKMNEVASEGRTVLFVSHNMPAVLNLCTRAMILESGHVVQIGDTEKLIHEYLNSGLAVASEKFFPEGRALKYPDTDLFFTGIRILNLRLEPTSFVKLSEGFNAEIYFCVKRPIRSAQVGISLWNDNGICVFTSTDLDEEGTQKSRYLQPGDYSFRVEVPSYLLRAGRYWIDLGSSVPRFRMLDIVEQAIAFEVFDDIEPELRLSGRRGIVSPILPWVNVTKDNNEASVGSK